MHSAEFKHKFRTMCLVCWGLQIYSRGLQQWVSSSHKGFNRGSTRVESHM